MAYKTFPVTNHALFKNDIVAMVVHFEPKSRRDLYLTELQYCYNPRQIFRKI